MNPKVTALSQPWQAEVCTRLRTLLREIPGADEDYKWNSPFYLVNGKQFASFSAFAKHVRLNIFNASGLEADDGFFDDSSTDERRALVIRAGDDPDYATLEKLLHQVAATLR